jgi:hypothetical protein
LEILVNPRNPGEGQMVGFVSQWLFPLILAIPTGGWVLHYLFSRQLNSAKRTTVSARPWRRLIVASALLSYAPSDRYLFNALVFLASRVLPSHQAPNPVNG